MDVPSEKPGKRIAVVGVCGSGKTTLAQILAERLGYHYICNDAIIWGPNWTVVPKSDRPAIFKEQMSKTCWTFDGNFGSMKDAEDRYTVARMDTLIWLDYSRLESHWQLFWRTVHRAWTKQELWHGNYETYRKSFFSRDSILLWALKSYRVRKQQYGQLFQDPELKHIKRIRLTSRKQLNAWLKAMDTSKPESRA